MYTQVQQGARMYSLVSHAILKVLSIMLTIM